MNRFLLTLFAALATYTASAQKLSLLTAHVVLEGNHSTYESGDSTLYYYSGLRGHGDLYHSYVKYDSSILFWKTNQGYYLPSLYYYKEFDSAGNAILSKQYLNPFSWDKDSNSYGSFNNLIFSRHAYKANSNAAFVEDGESEYFYNQDSTLNYSIGRFYDFNSSMWTDSRIDTYVYNNKKLVYRLIKDWKNNSWENNRQMFRTYEDDNVKELRVEQWTNGVWTVGENHIYNYNTLGLLSEDSSGNNIDSFFYDVNNNIALKAHWSVTSSPQKLLWRETFTYDTLNRLVLRIREIPNNSSWSYANGECGDHYYYNDTITIVPVSVEKANIDDKIALFPNPATKEIKIKFNGLTDEQVTLSIVDMSGKMIRKWDNHLNTTALIIPVDNLKPGIYYLSVHSKTQSGSRQFIVLQ